MSFGAVVLPPELALRRCRCSEHEGTATRCTCSVRVGARAQASPTRPAYLWDHSTRLAGAVLCEPSHEQAALTHVLLRSYTATGCPATCTRPCRSHAAVPDGAISCSVAEVCLLLAATQSNMHRLSGACDQPLPRSWPSAAEHVGASAVTERLRTRSVLRGVVKSALRRTCRVRVSLCDGDDVGADGEPQHVHVTSTTGSWPAWLAAFEAAAFATGREV